jgi:predicted O-methyltransferase YrrM
MVAALMQDAIWSDVDAYLAATLLPSDRLMQDVLAANAQGQLPAIDVPPVQGRFLELLVRMTGARRILEIGTLGAYSTIWMGRALPPGGRIVTLEHAEAHARVARQNIERAGLTDRIDVRVGPALETLPGVQADGLAPFDLVFIDADKPNNPRYLEWAITLARAGTVIVLDNVIRDGKVVDERSGDASVDGTRAGLALMGSHPRLKATALQTVGVKGYDGFAIAIVL